MNQQVYFTYATEKRRESVCFISSLYIDLFFYFHATVIFCGISDFDVLISSLVLSRSKDCLTFLAKSPVIVCGMYFCPIISTVLLCKDGLLF